MRTPTIPLLMGAGLFAVACQDKSVSILQEPPAVTVQEPSSGSSFYTGQSILFKALAQTYDGTDLTDLTHQWVSGNETICLSDAVPADGYATCSWAYSAVGEYTVTVTVTDPRLSSATASVSVNIIENSSPEVTIVAPTPDEVFAVDDLIVFEGETSDAEESSENIFITVSSSEDGDVTSGYATSSGQFSGGATLSAGTHLITMLAEDSYGRTAQDTLTIDVFEHGPPSISSVDITPSPATTVDDLTADVQGWADLEGSKERNRYAWYISNDKGKMELDKTQSTAVYTSAKTIKGDLIQVAVTPYNDYGDGETTLSAIVEIVNSAPTVPTVTIEPTSPEPSDSLYCYASGSTDADEDSISYSYAWYQNGTVTTITSNVVSDSYTSHGDTWECVVTPSDGEDSGSTGSDYVSINDTESPDAPVIDTPSAYRNDEEVTLTGTCEAGCDLTLYCEDDTTTWSDTQTCDSDSTFAYTTALTAGYTTSCYATCTDDAGNLSGDSNTVTTEVCDPGDEYEDSAGTGDDGANAIDQWSAIADDASSTITIEANILEGDSEDWYKISSSDDVSEDRTQGLDYYNFAVEMIDGSSTYSLYVYKGTYDSTDNECSSSATEYSDYMEDQGDGSHSVPSEARSCATSSSSYNECEDNSNDYYIQVVRNSSTVSSCQGYELEVTNGVW